MEEAHWNEAKELLRDDEELERIKKYSFSELLGLANYVKRNRKAVFAEEREETDRFVEVLYSILLLRDGERIEGISNDFNSTFPRH